MPIQPALFEETRNIGMASSSNLPYRLPDFMETVRDMRENLFQLQANNSLEPTSDKEVLRRWKIRNKAMYGTDNVRTYYQDL